MIQVNDKIMQIHQEKKYMGVFLADKVDNVEVLTGDVSADKPSYCGFINIYEAILMINKHSFGKKPILCHPDIDMDGIGSAYILNRFMQSQGVSPRISWVINREKEHGINSKLVGYINSNDIDLLIVLDSSTNEIELIKKMKCDVLVVDHHDILHTEMRGKTARGEYVIVSNMVGNSDVSKLNELLENQGVADRLEPFTMSPEMSGGLVLYELLRVYSLATGQNGILEKMMLDQWAGITLYTDVISMRTSRNQYYTDRTVHNLDIEPGLSLMVKSLNKYQNGVDKTFISYTLAPAVNSAIRAGDSYKALDLVLNHPEKVGELNQYKEIQREIASSAMENIIETHTFVMKNITDTGISKSYAGLLATKICSESNKNTVVYLVSNGLAVGSFRGRRANVDYRDYFEKYSPGIYAQGHKAAFGFKVNENMLREIMGEIHKIELSQPEYKYYLTAGKNLSIYDTSKFHIGDMDKFKKEGNLVRLAMANSKLSSEEAVYIVVSSMDSTIVEEREKVIFYDVLGLRCMAYSRLKTRLIKIYVEMTKEIKLYVSEVKE